MHDADRPLAQLARTRAGRSARALLLSGQLLTGSARGRAGSAAGPRPRARRRSPSSYPFPAHGRCCGSELAQAIHAAAHARGPPPPSWCPPPSRAPPPTTRWARTRGACCAAPAQAGSGTCACASDFALSVRHYVPVCYALRRTQMARCTSTFASRLNAAVPGGGVSCRVRCLVTMCEWRWDDKYK